MAVAADEIQETNAVNLMDAFRRTLQVSSRTCSTTDVVSAPPAAAGKTHPPPRLMLLASRARALAGWCNCSRNRGGSP